MIASTENSERLLQAASLTQVPFQRTHPYYGNIDWYRKDERLDSVAKVIERSSGRPIHTYESQWLLQAKLREVAMEYKNASRVRMLFALAINKQFACWSLLQDLGKLPRQEQDDPQISEVRKCLEDIQREERCWEKQYGAHGMGPY